MRRRPGPIKRLAKAAWRLEAAGMTARRRAMRRVLAVLSMLAAPATTAAQEPAFYVGDRFIYQRTAFDAAGTASAPGTVTWEVLESTAEGHRIRVTEPIGGEAVSSEWDFNRANNALAQHLGRCRIVNDPDSGRYAWPLQEGAAWDAVFTVSEVCGSAGEEVTLRATCSLAAEAVAVGTYRVQEIENPAAAIQRLVICEDARNPGAFALRFEQEFLCPELGVRCFFAYDWVILGPEVASEELLEDYRDDPEAQRYDGRVEEELVEVQLQ